MFKKLLNSFKRQHVFVKLIIAAAALCLICGCCKKLYEGFAGGSSGNELVLFHMTGCGHCKAMMPEWDKFASSNQTGVKCTKVERKENPTLLKKHGITGFPTILMLDSKGNKVANFNGPRNAPGLEAFAKQHS